MRIILGMGLVVLLSGCIAKTAVDIVTLPVKAVGAGFDAVTTSQSEADEKRGRAARKDEERAGKEARQREKEDRKRAKRDREDAEDWEG